jgi:hypothetical protein
MITCCIYCLYVIRDQSASYRYAVLTIPQRTTAIRHPIALLGALRDQGKPWIHATAMTRRGLKDCSWALPTAPRARHTILDSMRK